MLRTISESLVWSGVSANGADAAVTLLLCYCGRRRACERRCNYGPKAKGTWGRAEELCGMQTVSVTGAG